MKLCAKLCAKSILCSHETLSGQWMTVWLGHITNTNHPPGGYVRAARIDHPHRKYISPDASSW